jgi:hypothetical protein
MAVRLSEKELEAQLTRDEELLRQILSEDQGRLDAREMRDHMRASADDDLDVEIDDDLDLLDDDDDWGDEEDDWDDDEEDAEWEDWEDEWEDEDL